MLRNIDHELTLTFEKEVSRKRNDNINIFSNNKIIDGDTEVSKNVISTMASKRFNKRNRKMAQLLAHKLRLHNIIDRHNHFKVVFFKTEITEDTPIGIEFAAKQNGNGVIVKNIIQNSIASKKRIRRGMSLEKVNNINVNGDTMEYIMMIG